MKKIVLLFLMLSYPAFGQVLNVKQVTQQETEWCWAGVTSCILDYYGSPTEQCKIAEYTREVSEFVYYGDKNCCQYPNGDCNYSDYFFDSKGSVEDILHHFDSIESIGLYNKIELNDIKTEIAAGRPFLIRWEWNDSGDGHFMVGYGFMDSLIYYMNPLMGEGKKIADYDWLVHDPQHVHTWTHSLQITTKLSDVGNNVVPGGNLRIYPNPVSNSFRVSGIQSGCSGEITDSYGNTVIGNIDLSESISVSGFPNGVYYLRIKNTIKQNILPFIVLN